MPTNDFIGFASAGSANIMSQADYAAAAEQTDGVQPGPASSKLANKAWRQGANMAAAIGQFIVKQGFNALDNGDLSALLKSLLSAVSSLVEYDATVDYPVGALIQSNGVPYISISANGPSTTIKNPDADTTGATWQQIIPKKSTTMDSNFENGGYLLLGNNLLVQWGAASTDSNAIAPGSSQNVTVTFSIPYPRANAYVSYVSFNGNIPMIGVRNSRSSDGTTMRIACYNAYTSNTNSRQFDWITVGVAV